MSSPPSARARSIMPRMPLPPEGADPASRAPWVSSGTVAGPSSECRAMPRPSALLDAETEPALPLLRQAEGWEALDVELMTSTVATAVDDFGKVNVLVNNAGIVNGSTVQKFRLDKWRQIIDVNLTGTFIGIQTVADPMPGVREALVIAGSDKRGAIYGIYDLSQAIGVSPWYWWADVPVVRRDRVRVNYGEHVHGPPAVKYRGIFLNDEAPALTGWADEKFGDLN